MVGVGSSAGRIEAGGGKLTLFRHKKPGKDPTGYLGFDLFVRVAGRPQAMTVPVEVELAPRYLAVLEILAEAQIQDRDLSERFRGWRRAETIAEMRVVDKETITSYFSDIVKAIGNEMLAILGARFVVPDGLPEIIQRKPGWGARFALPIEIVEQAGPAAVAPGRG